MPRLGYSKSRTGCLKCRQRRVKCDEKRPCTACKRHGVLCSLTTDAGTSSASTSTPVPAPRNIASPARSMRAHALPSAHQQLQMQTQTKTQLAAVYSTPPAMYVDPSTNGPPSALISADDWVVDMELMHHYSTTAYRTLPRADEVGRTWLMQAVSAAYKETYLLHVILAFSAFHLAHHNPGQRSRHAYAAARHQNLGICGLREAITHADEENCHALFMASSLLAIVSFAAMTVHADDPADARPDLDDMVGVYILLKGMEHLLSSWQFAIHDGPFRELFLPSKPFTPISATSASIVMTSADLSPAGTSPSTSKRMFDAVRDAPAVSPVVTVSLPDVDGAPLPPFWAGLVEHLREMRKPLADRVRSCQGTEDTIACVDHEIACFVNLSMRCVTLTTSPELRVVTQWAIEASDRFVQLVKDREPAALVVVAYYCVVVAESAGQSWFTRGWAPKLLRAIRASLPEHYVDLIAWPLNCAGAAS